MRAALSALLALLAGPVYADNIDYFFKFSSETQAETDIALAQHYVTSQGVSQWDQSIIFANISVWRPAQDTTDANGNVTHTYLPGYYIMASLSAPVVPAAFNDNKIVVILDRDTNAVLKDNLDTSAPYTALNALAFSPVPAGTSYPFGAFQ